MQANNLTNKQPALKPFGLKNTPIIREQETPTKRTCMCMLFVFMLISLVKTKPKCKVDWLKLELVSFFCYNNKRSKQSNLPDFELK